MSINLTSREAQILVNWPTNYNTAEDNKDDNATWAEASDFVGNGMSIKTVKGILGSLAKKGLVEGGHEKANGVAGDLQVLTDAGIDEVFRLRAEMTPAPADAPLDDDQAALDAAVADLDQAKVEALLEAPAEGAADLDQDPTPDMTPDDLAALDAPVEEPEAEATPREKLTMLALDGTVLTSRRVPTLEAATLVISLVEQFGGGQAHEVKAIHDAGFDAEALKRASKRIKSWFGTGRAGFVRGGFVVNLKLPVAEVEG